MKRQMFNRHSHPGAPKLAHFVTTPALAGWGSPAKQASSAIRVLLPGVREHLLGDVWGRCEDGLGHTSELNSTFTSHGTARAPQRSAASPTAETQSRRFPNTVRTPSTFKRYPDQPARCLLLEPLLMGPLCSKGRASYPQAVPDNIPSPAQTTSQTTVWLDSVARFGGEHPYQRVSLCRTSAWDLLPHGRPAEPCIPCGHVRSTWDCDVSFTGASAYSGEQLHGTQQWEVLSFRAPCTSICASGCPWEGHLKNVLTIPAIE